MGALITFLVPSSNPKLAPDIVGIWGVNQQMVALLLSVSVFFSLYHSICISVSLINYFKAYEMELSEAYLVAKNF